jgi:hypothetical protein
VQLLVNPESELLTETEIVRGIDQCSLNLCTFVNDRLNVRCGLRSVKYRPELRLPIEYHSPFPSNLNLPDRDYRLPRHPTFRPPDSCAGQLTSDFSRSIAAGITKSGPTLRLRISRILGAFCVTEWPMPEASSNCACRDDLLLHLRREPDTDSDIWTIF